MKTKDSKEEVKKKIATDPDFINSKKYGNSLRRYLQNNQSSPDNVIAHLLCMSREEVDAMYQAAITKIRQFMKIDL